MSNFATQLKAFKRRVFKDAVADGPSFEGTRGGNKGQKRKRSVDVDNVKVAKAVKKKKKGSKCEDPSVKYLKNPLKAPVCFKAKNFMQDVGFKKTFKIVLGPKTGWRTSCKLSVRGNPPVVGLFAPGSHEIIPLEESAVQHESINKVVRIFAQAIVKLKVPGYDGKNPGGVSYVALNVESSTGKVQLIVVFNSKSPDEYIGKYKKVLAAINKQAPNLLHSAWMHCNPANKHNNAIYSHDRNAWELIQGRDCVEESLTKVKSPKGLVLYFPPFVFRQANLAGFQNIIKEIRKWTPANSKVVELYGGVGTIGLHLTDLARSVDCSDENPNNADCFTKSLSTLPPKLRAKVAPYKPQSAENVIKNGCLDNNDLLVVDPPRKGLDRTVLDAIFSSPRIKRIIYVSCGFKAFRRDCEDLVSNGFKIAHAEGHILFPGADHIETLCIFDKV
uniref:Uncharacterized protein n=1 Tax=Mucochytrium quahogii TaxID=96639 RepID=A0A7S2W5Z1_9STRA|mmetsp:Transcript_6427/g.11139  ORF Transcript_6427/g.11139 Transcript_6427/m.11139 type:complete len:445 (-) Transcript_6427:407-1741(-)